MILTLSCQAKNIEILLENIGPALIVTSDLFIFIADA